MILERFTWAGLAENSWMLLRKLLFPIKAVTFVWRFLCCW